MTDVGNIVTQRECAKRALRRLFVSRLARKLIASGVLVAIGAQILRYASSPFSPYLHPLDDLASLSLQPLRDSGVAAGGAGGGGSGMSVLVN